MVKLSGLPEPQAQAVTPAASAVQPVGGQSLDSNELRALATILGIAGQLSSEGGVRTFLQVAFAYVCMRSSDVQSKSVKASPSTRRRWLLSVGSLRASRPFST